MVGIEGTQGSVTPNTNRADITAASITDATISAGFDIALVDN